jgi:KaiC/GvpD/RAD55 family RecA-like ATPase
MGKEVLHEPAAPDFLVIADNISVLDRCNEEKYWIEPMLPRVYPMGKSRLLTHIGGILGSGVDSEWAYKQLEVVSDCVIDFKLDETGPETRDVMRIRNMRNAPFDRKRHTLRTLPNHELKLEN